MTKQNNKFNSWRYRWMNCPFDARNHFFTLYIYVKMCCLCFRYATFSTHFYFHLLSPWCVLKSCQPNKQISAFPISLIKDSLMMYAVLSRKLLIWLPGSSVLGILQAKKLEWISIPFSSGSSQPWDWTWVSCIAAGFFTIWAIMESLGRAQGCC